jgi:hypothetical protein
MTTTTTTPNRYTTAHTSETADGRIMERTTELSSTVRIGDSISIRLTETYTFDGEIHTRTTDSYLLSLEHAEMLAHSLIDLTLGNA